MAGNNTSWQFPAGLKVSLNKQFTRCLHNFRSKSFINEGDACRFVASKSTQIELVTSNLKDFESFKHSIAWKVYKTDAAGPKDITSKDLVTAGKIYYIAAEYNTFLGKLTALSVEFKPSKLKPGLSYIFQASAKNTVSKAEQECFAESPPRGGSCVTSSNGKVHAGDASTTVAITCMNWLDNGNRIGQSEADGVARESLTFTAFVIGSDGAEQKLSADFAGESNSNVTLDNIIMPFAGSKTNNYNVEVIVRVYDQYWAYATVRNLFVQVLPVKVTFNVVCCA